MVLHETLEIQAYHQYFNCFMMTYGSYLKAVQGPAAPW